MNHSPDHLIGALKRNFCPFVQEGLTLEEFRDLRDCVQIAFENGAWRNNPEVIYKKLDDPRRVYKSKGDAIADIDAGVEDVLDKGGR